MIYEKQQICQAGHRLYQEGLLHAACGNISCRRADQSLLITASGMNKGSLQTEDILLLSPQGQLLETAPAGLKPSSETGLHIALYQALPQAQAIVHTHPPYATALANSGQLPDWQLLEEARLFLEPLALLPPLPAGSPRLVAAAETALGANPSPKALLLTGHGALSWGESLIQAVERMEILEHLAKVLLYTRLWQGLAPLS